LLIFVDESKTINTGLASNLRLKAGI